MASNQWSDLPEVYHQPDLPEVVPTEVAQKSPEVLFAKQDVSPKYDAHCGGLESTDGQYSPAPEVVNAAGVPRGERRICGVKRRLFIILAIIGSIVIIGAIVGGAVGGTMAAHSSSSSSSNATTTTSATATSSTPSATSSISPNSGLASVNWTDSSGYDHYYVFHQARDNSIISSIWDSQNKTWEARNVSADVADSDGSSLDVIAGTPIAATAWTDDTSEWNIRLYVLLTGNLIGELYTTNSSATSTWSQYPTSPMGFTTGSGSNLAAWRPNGGTSDTYPILLAWQEEDGKLMYANGTGEDWTNTQNFGEQAVNKSGIAMTDLNDGSLAFKVYFDSSGAMLEIQGDLSDIASFGFGNNKGSIGDLNNASTANYAATSFNSIYLLVANLDTDGGIVARSYDNTEWSSDTQPNLLNSPKSISASSDFKAIAMHKDKRVYGLVNDAIYEWKFAEFSPTDWTYVGKVNTTLSS